MNYLHSTLKRRVVIVAILHMACWNLSAFAKDALKLRIENILGQSQYPLVIQGLREVIISDLARDPLLSLSQQSDAELSLQIFVQDSFQEVRLSISLLNQEKRYNLGTKKVVGNYSDIRSLQNNLYLACQSLLKTTTDNATSQKILQSHTSNISSVYQLGNASSLMAQNKFPEAVSSLDAVVKNDPSFDPGKDRAVQLGKKISQQSKDLVLAGNIYATNGNPQKAFEQYEEALLANAKHPAALLSKAKLLSSQGRYEDAMVSLKMAVAVDPNNPEIHAAIGKTLMAQGKLPEASNSLSMAIQLGNVDPTVYDSLGQIYQKNKQAAEASRMFQKAGDISANIVDLRNSQKYYQKALENEKSDPLTIKEADALIKAGDMEVALQYISRQLISNPDNDALLSLQGYALYLNKQPAQALKRCYASVEINPKNYLANYVIGLILSKDTQSLKEAAKYLEQARALKPEQSEPAILLSEVYLKLERHEVAIKLLEEMSHIRPRDALVQIRLGDAYLSFEKIDDAANAYQKAIAIAPHMLEAHEGLALIYIQKRDRQHLLEKLETIFELDASDNLMIRNGPSLFANLLPKTLLETVEKLPKTSGAGFEENSINQISIAQISPDKWVERKLLPNFQLYTVDQKLIQQDLTLALYSKYRVISSAKVPGITLGTIFDKDLANVAITSEIAKQSKLDGILGYAPKVKERSDVIDKLSLRLMLYTVAGNSLFGPAEKSPLPEIMYPHGVAVKFNSRAIMNYILLLLGTFGPILGFLRYRSIKLGKGSVKIIIHYDPSLESFLTLKLSKKELTPKDSQSLIVKDKQQAEKKKFKSLLKQTGTFVQQMVGKTSLFEKVPAGNYYCYLFGTIEDTGLTKRTVGNYFMFQQFSLKKDETKEIIFQLEREDAYVVVHAYENDAPIDGVEITIMELNQPRYTRAQQGAFFYLKKGSYTVRAQHQGKQYFQDLIIDKLADIQLIFNLSDVASLSQKVKTSEDILKKLMNLKGLAGPQDAVALLQSTGQESQANELAAENALADGNYEKAAQIYAKAKDYLRASEVWKNAGNDQKYHDMRAAHFIQQQDFTKAIPHLEESNNLAMLAKVHQKMGDTKLFHETMARLHLEKGEKQDAAQAYMAAEEYTKAAELYEDMNQTEKAAAIYAKSGNFELAGQLFTNIGDQKRAALSYEKGGYFEEACKLYDALGEHEKVISLLTANSHYLQAAKKLIAQSQVDDAITLLQKVPHKYASFEETQVLLANLIAKKGMKDLALRTLQKISRNSGANFDLETHYVYADLLEGGGENAAALEAFESLMTRDFHFKDVEQRIQSLRSKPMALSPNPTQTIAGGVSVYQAERRYEIMQELGRGGMGVVYKARDKKLDRIVAFKTLPHSLHTDPEALAALQREAQLAAKLHHPNIVTVFDVGEEAGDYYIAMEYVEGKTLQNVLEQVGKLNLEAFIAIFKALASCIQFAHDHQIIHRDLKPSNILVSPKTKTIKLMDFGLAKLLENLSIDKTMLRGTPLYISPEQILGQDIDKRTDLYSMGIMMYETLSGTPPFLKGDIMYAHLHTAPEPILTKLPKLNPHIAAMIMKCIEKKKENRPANADEILKVLEA